MEVFMPNFCSFDLLLITRNIIVSKHISVCLTFGRLVLNKTSENIVKLF